MAFAKLKALAQSRERKAESDEFDAGEVIEDSLWVSRRSMSCYFSKD
jgi:hypothetical protein